MPINKQTANQPPIDQSERSFSLELRSFASYIAPGPGMRSGLKLGIPLSSGQPTTGLTPTLTNGVILDGDHVIGPNAKNISAAPKNVANRKFFYGLSGFYYADSTNVAVKPTDVLMGEVTTNNETTASILTIAQPYNYGAGRYAVRALVNLALCTKGADVNLFTWTKPASFDNVRISHAQAVVATVATAGNTAGDDFLVKVGSTTLVTVDDAVLTSAGAVTLGTPAATWVFGSSTSELVFKYNQTDTSTALAGGLMEVTVLLECF